MKNEQKILEKLNSIDSRLNKVDMSLNKMNNRLISVENNMVTKDEFIISQDRMTKSLANLQEAQKMNIVRFDRIEVKLDTLKIDHDSSMDKIAEIVQRIDDRESRPIPFNI